MEEVKMLVEMVSKLPGMALWAMAIFYAYKVVVIGSIYGLIRFAITKAHGYLLHEKTKVVDVHHKVGSLVITAEMGSLIDELKRLRGKGLTIQSQYIHSQSVSWLREAINDKIAKDSAKDK